MLRIADRSIGENQSVFIIAEAGVNHSGDQDLALELVDAAASTGADAVKFQTFTAEELVYPEAPSAEHHVANVHSDISHFELLKKLELPFEFFAELKSYVESKGLIFISTPYDIPSAEYLGSIEVACVKMASGELTNFPLVDAVIGLDLPVIFSTGMNAMDTVRTVVDKFAVHGCRPAILKCTSNYPVDLENVNLRGITTLRREFPENVIGFSDHSPGHELACVGVGMGAAIIEKHITLDKKLWGPDQAASMEPEEFSQMVTAVRKTEKALGSEKIEVIETELGQKHTMQKGVYARHEIHAGQVISLADLMFLRPEAAISALDYEQLIGHRSKLDYLPLAPIQRTELKV